MTYQIETIEKGLGISLVGYKHHITLYHDDLKKEMGYNVTADNFVKRVESWLWDIICDEYGSDSVSYNNALLEHALREIWCNLRKDFESSPEYSKEKEIELANAAKKQAELDAQFGWKEMNPIFDSVFRANNLWYVSSSWKPNDWGQRKMSAYHDMENYVKTHKEEFIPMSDSERKARAAQLYQEFLKERANQ